jgi:hypothetical protein
MTTQLPPNASLPTPRPTRNLLVGGIALILIGALTLVGQVFNLESLGLLVLPTLALIFLVWGLLTRTAGLLVPGGILGGVGLGAILIEQSWAPMSETVQGGIFLLCFAGGWALITLLSRFVGPKVVWWPLIPGGILAAIGGLLLAGDVGLEALEGLRYAWPIALIIIGLYLILRRYTKA